MVRKADLLNKYKAWQLRAAIRKHNQQIRGGTTDQYMPLLGKKKKAQMVSFLVKNYTLHNHAQGHELKSRKMSHVLRRNAQAPRRAARAAPRARPAPRAAPRRQRAPSPPPLSPPRSPSPAPPARRAVIPATPEKHRPLYKNQIDSAAGQLRLGDMLYATDKYLMGRSEYKLIQSSTTLLNALKAWLGEAVQRRDASEVYKYKQLIVKARDGMVKVRRAYKKKPPDRATIKEHLALSYPTSKKATWKKVRVFLRPKPNANFP